MIHFLEMMQSAGCQSLSIERDHILIGAFDILPAQEDEIYFHYRTKAEDYCLYYLFPVDKENDTIFLNSLILILHLFFSHAMAGDLLISVPIAEMKTNREIVEAGFTFLQRFRYGKEMMNLYRFERDAFQRNVLLNYKTS